MVTVSEVMAAMEQIAPRNLACSWDNVGLQIGVSSREINKVLIALDCVDGTVDEALEIGAGLIITHHPPFHGAGVTSLTDENPFGRRMLKLAENKIAVFSAHTNFDAAAGGTNDTLCRLFNLTEVEPFLKDGEGFLGRVGRLREKMTLRELSVSVGEILDCGSVRFVGGGDRVVVKVALCAGGGGNERDIEAAAIIGADVYITGDTKYHAAQTALSLGLALIDATHYATEVPAMISVKRRLKAAFEVREVEFVTSRFNGQVYN